MRGSTCKHCSGTFHACGSCGLIFEWEYYYCSEKCWLASEQYRMIRARAETLVSKLDEEGMEALRFILDDTDLRVPILEDVWSGVSKKDNPG